MGKEDSRRRRKKRKYFFLQRIIECPCAFSHSVESEWLEIESEFERKSDILSFCCKNVNLESDFNYDNSDLNDLWIEKPLLEVLLRKGKVGYNELGYNELGYNELGYNELGYNELGYN